MNKNISHWFALQDEDSEFTLAADFEIGHFFRERIVPRAVLYFTGEAIEDDDNVCMPSAFCLLVTVYIEIVSHFCDLSGM